MVTQYGSNWPKTASGVLLIGALWFLTGPVFGHMGPPWPCVAAGVFLALCAGMLWYKPGQHRGWGTLATIVAGSSLFLGAGAIIPALLGVVGGVTGAMWNEPESV